MVFAYLFAFISSAVAMETPERLPLYQFDNNQDGLNYRSFYLLPTHHSESYSLIHPDVREQIESCPELYVEQGPKIYDPSVITPPIDMSPGLRSQDNPKEDWLGHLSDDSRKVLNSLMPAEKTHALQAFRPQFAYIQIVLSFKSQERSMGMDHTVAQLFFERCKPVHGLCDNSDFVNILNALEITNEDIDKSLFYIGQHRDDFFSTPPYLYGNLSLLEKSFDPELSARNPIRNFSNQLCFKRTLSFGGRLLIDSGDWQASPAVLMGEQHLPTVDGIIAFFQNKNWNVRQLTSQRNYILLEKRFYSKN